MAFPLFPLLVDFTQEISQRKKRLTTLENAVKSDVVEVSRESRRYVSKVQNRFGTQRSQVQILSPRF